MTMSRHFGALLLLCGAASSATAASAAPSYKLTLLDSIYGTAVGINNAGVIAGNRWSPDTGGRAFSWSAGQMNVLPADMRSARGISGQGHIAGVSDVFEEGGGYQMTMAGLVYHQGVVTGVGEEFQPNTSSGSWYRFTTAVDVNSSGTAAVNTEATGGAFLAHASGNTVLPMWRAAAINDAGQVAGTSSYAAGSHAVLYGNGGVIDLGTLPNDSNNGMGSTAFDLNDAGAVVGSSNYGFGEASHMHSFLYQNGQMVAIGDWTNTNYAKAVNNLGTVIGSYRSDDPADSGEHAYLYFDGEQYDLDTLLTGSAGWRISTAEDINDSGEIVGQACNQAGACFAALLSPVPEPATYAMLLAGLGLMGWRRLRLGR